MGSSGAGKTTLLNTLTFRSASNIVITGSRTINNLPINSSTLASLSAYVQQDDLFFANLTVREHLVFQVNIYNQHGNDYMCLKCNLFVICFSSDLIRL